MRRHAIAARNTSSRHRARLARLVIARRAMTSLVELSSDQLLRIAGGDDNAAFGRCGPADRWKWLGDVYTPQ
jgi:predicted transcriptional regulator